MHTPTSRLRNLGPRARSTPPDAVRDIRRRVEAGEKLDSVAASHGITTAAACMIANGQRRREVV